MEESTSSPTTQLGLIEQSFNCRYSRWVREALDELPESFTITDPSISGHPIVFASRGFLKMTGYSREEVIGKNGRVFQGPRTNRRSVMEIRQAIREERTVEVSLLNYRKDGTPFWMLFLMSPVFGKKDGRVINFVAVQVPIYAKQRRNGARFSDGGSGLPEVVLGSCRREVCSDSLLDFGLVLSLDTNPRESENDEIELSEASDLNKQRALGAINNILSVLTHYSESTGRVVCGKRCCLPGAGFLSSSLNISLGRIKQSFVLTDSQLPDMPIVYASDAFLKLTGYDRHEVLGRNCRFLSGEDTDSLTLYQIKQSIHGERACTVRILNYRKDKSIFWNFLHISPVRNASGKIAYFVGVQIEECCKNQDINGLNPDRRQLSAVGAVKIAVRSSSMGAGSSLS
ncbi:protein TWIN LOV 1 isoform X1 [Carica papaya]|uniref:protein TWIN LOV 1 isoform X1 n=1 Tax=Carica papaya TaxID=3649 RepID=UPI000B8CD001|nr:protein TWIN LOV 1 isoform X1 [Carica papaya]